MLFAAKQCNPRSNGCLSDLAIKFVDELQLGDQLVCQLPIAVTN